VRQQQSQQFTLVNEFSAEARLHLGGSEQELITAWKISIGRLGICDNSAILLLSASTLTSLFFPRLLLPPPLP
jgi:hypothetical protein